jgi:preprotein translocase subunit YajC
MRMISAMVFGAVLAAEGSGGRDYASWMIMGAVFLGLFWFLVLRPQQKRESAKQELMAGLKERDKVVTVGGIHGTVRKVGAETVVLQIDDSGPVQVKVAKNAVARVVKPSSKGGEVAEDKAGSKSKGG